MRLSLTSTTSLPAKKKFDIGFDGYIGVYPTYFTGWAENTVCYAEKLIIIWFIILGCQSRTILGYSEQQLTNGKTVNLAKTGVKNVFKGDMRLFETDAVSQNPNATVNV